MFMSVVYTYNMCVYKLYINVDVRSIIVYTLYIPDIWAALQQRFSRGGHASALRDVYDGVGYKCHLEYLSHPAHVSLLTLMALSFIVPPRCLFGPSGLLSMNCPPHRGELFLHFNKHIHAFSFNFANNICFCWV